MGIARYRMRTASAARRPRSLGCISLPSRRVDGTRRRGQALVEFALIFPIFITMMMGFIEFTFVFNALLSMGHATRDAALIAAEAGNAASADCVTLQTIENDVSAPTDKARIQQVAIYWTDSNGQTILGQNVYTRTGSTTCTLPDGTNLTVPYKLSGAAGYDITSRCNVLAGCGSRKLDTIGVKISYQHTWVTPLANLVSLGGTGVTLTQSNAMRMEPVL